MYKLGKNHKSQKFQKIYEVSKRLTIRVHLDTELKINYLLPWTVLFSPDK